LLKQTILVRKESAVYGMHGLMFYQNVTQISSKKYIIYLSTLFVHVYLAQRGKK
jgi:hypothetical protein